MVKGKNIYRSNGEMMNGSCKAGKKRYDYCSSCNSSSSPTLTNSESNSPRNRVDRPRGSDSRPSRAEACGRMKMTSAIVSLSLNRIHIFVLLIVVSHLIRDTDGVYKRREDKSKCPEVKAIRNFGISEFLGSWYIVQYYASSEEALAYKCMRAELSVSSENAEVTMNFTYSFIDDPINEQLGGNITWLIPSPDLPAHWVHAEDTYEGVYNTYVLDSDYKSWALLMHCAEKSKSPRYLSSLIMSREPDLGVNVISYLREKLPRYDIDLEYMFPMTQINCSTTADPGLELVTPSVVPKTKKRNGTRRHPLRRKHRRF